MMRRFDLTAIAMLLGIAALLLPRIARAHSGPPFPILVDQPIPGHIVTIWADPDIGEALFYIVLEPKPGETASPAAVREVELWTQPVNGRLPKASHLATQESARDHLRFVAKPEFDTAELWTIGVEIRLVDGTNHSLVAQVESTPPGLGAWDLLLYIFPFVVFGTLWGVVFVRRSRAAAVKSKMACTRSAALHEAKPRIPS